MRQYGAFQDYGIVDRDGRSIFGLAYRTLGDAVTVVQDCFDTAPDARHIYKPLFPVTIEGRDASDICHPVMTIQYRLGE